MIATTHKIEPAAHVPLMPLEKALVGQTVKLETVTNSDERLAHRLVEMGLTRGCRLEIINRGPGPFIVALRNSRLVLGRGMVNRMMVRPLI